MVAQMLLLERLATIKEGFLEFVPHLKVVQKTNVKTCVVHKVNVGFSFQTSVVVATFIDLVIEPETLDTKVGLERA
jgi:hypothetical protein